MRPHRPRSLSHDDALRRTEDRDSATLPATQEIKQNKLAAVHHRSLSAAVNDNGPLGHDTDASQDIDY